MAFVGIALMMLGYSIAYSGSSQLKTGGKGWGIMESMLGPGIVTASAITNASDTSGQGFSGLHTILYQGVNASTGTAAPDYTSGTPKGQLA